MPAKTQNFERAKRRFAFHRWSRIFLCITLVLGLNYLGMTFYLREDITLGNLYSLTPETRDYISKLDQDVHIYITYGAESDSTELRHFMEDVRGLLREYEYNANLLSRGSIQTHYIDVFQQRKEAETLARQFGVQQSHLIIFSSGDRHRIIRPNELYETKGLARTAFRGEQVFTTALLQVISDHKPTVYFLSGHGEMRPDDVDPLRGVSAFAQALLERNYAVYSLNINDIEQIPAEANLVVVLSPQASYDRASQEKLRRYLQPVSPRVSSDGEVRERSAGKLLLALDPGRPHGLDDLLLDWGILVDDVVVVDPSSQTVGGDLLINRFGSHPITSILVDNDIPVRLGWSRVVREDMGRDLSQPIEQVPLLFTSNASWGEKDYDQRKEPVYDEKTDIKGPLSVAMIAERSLQQFGIRLGPRLMVYGSADFLSNQQLGFVGNLPLALNSIRWLLDEEPQVQAPTRPINRIQILLSADQMGNLRLLMVLGIPGVFAIISIAVYLFRKR